MVRLRLVLASLLVLAIGCGHSEPQSDVLEDSPYYPSTEVLSAIRAERNRQVGSALEGLELYASNANADLDFSDADLAALVLLGDTPSLDSEAIAALYVDYCERLDVYPDDDLDGDALHEHAIGFVIEESTNSSVSGMAPTQAAVWLAGIEKAVGLERNCSQRA